MNSLRLRYWLSITTIAFAIFMTFSPQLFAEEEYYSGGAEDVAPPPAADPEVVCQNYLVNVRNDMLTQLAAERDRLNGIATCLTSPVDESGTCGEQTAGVLDSLEQYRNYEANRFLSTIGFDEYRGDAATLIRTNADFGLENRNTAIMGGFAPMTQMNPRFQGGFIGDHVQRFQDAQRPHLAGWWQNNITSERFPNWERCVATNDSGEVQWDSRDGSALLYPQFLDSPRTERDEDEEPDETAEVVDEPSDLQTDCDALRSFFQNSPQAPDITGQVAADSETALQNAETLQPWHGFLSRLDIIDPDPEILGQISHEELINLEVARAHNRLASRFVDFEDHVSRWDEDEIMQLLAFDQVRNAPATAQSCPGMEAPSGFQWSDLLHAIPGYSVVAASLDLRNNYTALVVGANGEQTYWQNHGDTSRDLAIGAAAAVPLAAAEVAAGRYVIGPGMELADPYVRPVLDAAGEVVSPAVQAARRAAERLRLRRLAGDVGILGDTGPRLDPTQLDIPAGYPRTADILPAPNRDFDAITGFPELSTAEIRAFNAANPNWRDELRELGWDTFNSTGGINYSQQIYILQNNIRAPTTNWVYHGTSTENFESILRHGLDNGRGTEVHAGGMMMRQDGRATYAGSTDFVSFYADNAARELGGRSMIMRFPVDTGVPRTVLGATSGVVPSDFIEYSLDGGATWYRMIYTNPANIQ